MTLNLILRIISTLQKVVSSRANNVMDPFGDTAAILNSVVSNSYYGMLRVTLECICFLQHPITAIENNIEFKMAAILPESGRV